MVDVSTKIAGLFLDGYVMNASGAKDTTEAELKELVHSKSAAVVLKSATLEPRNGNSEPRLAATKLGIIQSMGWPNLGYKKYVEIATILKATSPKPIIGSVAGFNTKDYITITKAYQESSIDLIEISLSCPNIEGHPQTGYEYKDAERLLSQLKDLGQKPIGVKLPPYLDYAKQEQMAEIILKSKISFVTTINSPGNSLMIDHATEKTLIKPRNGVGGLCGEYIKPLGLGNVWGYYNLLKGRGISIIGVGGISSGADIFEYLLAGADAVQVGTTLEKEGTNCFERLNREFREIMAQKGYKNINEVRGNLKSL